MDFSIYYKSNNARGIGSWLMSENSEKVKGWRGRLHQAHIEISDMFISNKPFLIYNVNGSPSDSLSGQISPGIYLCPPSRVLFGDIDCMVVNDAFWKYCLNNMNVSDTYDILDDMSIDELQSVDNLMEWSEKSGLHCFKVYQHTPKPIRFKITQPKFTYPS